MLLALAYTNYVLAKLTRCCAVSIILVLAVKITIMQTGRGACNVALKCIAVRKQCTYKLSYRVLGRLLIFT